MLKEKKYVGIRVSGEGLIHNRRSTYRLPLDINGSLRNFGKIIVHDISYNGISFYLPNDKLCSTGQDIVLMFKMYDIEYIVKGKIVRITQDPENRRVLYGCSTIPSPSIDNLIQEEQRNRIRKRRR